MASLSEMSSAPGLVHFLLLLQERNVAWLTVLETGKFKNAALVKAPGRSNPWQGAEGQVDTLERGKAPGQPTQLGI